MKIGDLVKFAYINGHCWDVNNKYAVYLGENFLVRKDDTVVENHKVLLQGQTRITIIDRALLRWLTVVK